MTTIRQGNAFQKIVENGGNALKIGVELRHMKTLKTIAIISIVSVGMTSSVLAAWWNPFSWKLFSKKGDIVTQNVSVTATTSQESFSWCNGSKYKKCSEGETFICPTNGEEAFCEKSKNDEIKTPMVKDSLTANNDTKLLKTESLKTVGQTGKPTAKIEKQSAENYNYLVVAYNESLTEAFERQLKLNIELKEIIDNRIRRSTEKAQIFQGYVVESVPEGVNIPNDAYRSLVKSYNGDANLMGILSKSEDGLIKGINEIISKLKIQREVERSKTFTKEQAIAQINVIIKDYSSLETLHGYLTKNYNSYITNAEEVDTSSARLLDALEQNAKSYARAGYTSSQNTQPVIKINIPKIELPKTTYCNTRYTGVKGNYETTCNERSF